MKYIIIVLVAFFTLELSCQDLIILNNGDEIESKVIDVNEKTIDFKRFSNLDGPTYHFNKEDVFKIKYANGEKDIFNKVPSQLSNEGYDRQKTKNSKEYIYHPDLGNANCISQRPKGASIYGNKANELFFRQDLVFYGYDLTYVKLSNASKVEQSSQLVIKYFNAWNAFLNKAASYEDFKIWLDKPNMTFGASVFPNYTNRDFNRFVESSNYCISFDDLQEIVSSYSLNENAGIGFVINLVNFNKYGEYSMAWLTFFNIKSREILYAVLVTGEAGKIGMVSHWGTGVENAIKKVFVNEVYSKKISNTKMLPSKLRLY